MTYRPLYALAIETMDKYPVLLFENNSRYGVELPVSLDPLTLRKYFDKKDKVKMLNDIGLRGKHDLSHTLLVDVRPLVASGIIDESRVHQIPKKRSK